ncbi:phosphate ABC transporter permease [Megasphaera cerevisiae DSM 20462]|jgi:phosphate transport system permease protein|uniref:Phosphate transport system permease protein n=1 Tax=Megasphaera cerevisiae DSM 20462 TaxID=1122219 RepID=A0A0J6ZQ48_9FIRM|nr:phosphate ABC transporter permease subunit PstC [Megasphaera cerevisiae]KMO87046.1 phosphate ABC transporter permease [Megasphaera cerevisiae DSM 20462]OKY53105.1 phosphate ABC transporter permease subunit PstC [Megasphaera cerevisiae]SJZ76944.1 phosphate transport system permease protein [Megasphaera cerevisiae DSM 20462]
MNAIETAVLKAHRNEKAARFFITVCGIGMALVPFLIGGFLLIKGIDTFTLFGHSLGEFLFSGQWDPSDTAEGGGSVGAGIYISGSLVTCALALLITLPLSIATAIFMTEIAKPRTRRLIQPAIELFTGIPSVVYGWIGMTVLIPFLRLFFPMPFGFSVLAAGIVLAVMIFPTITTMAADAMNAVPKQWREASYGLGATRWETIAHVVLPAAKGGIFTGIILGLARALGEALAVAMVIGQMKEFPTSLFLPASTLTTAISADMGGAMEGGEYSAALWTMALLLFVLSFLFIFLIHQLNSATNLKGKA